MNFIENLFPNCPKEKLKKKIDIPEPIHPSEEEATGNNNDNNHQPPPDDLDFPPIDPPQPDDGHINSDDSNDTTKPQSPPQRPPKPTIEEVIDDDTQAPLGGSNIPARPGPSQFVRPPIFTNEQDMELLEGARRYYPNTSNAPPRRFPTIPPNPIVPPRRNPP